MTETRGCLLPKDPERPSFTYACIYPEGHEGNHSFEDEIDTRLARPDATAFINAYGPPYVPGTCYSLWRYVGEGQPIWQAIMEADFSVRRGGFNYPAPAS